MEPTRNAQGGRGRNRKRRGRNRRGQGMNVHQKNQRLENRKPLNKKLTIADRGIDLACRLPITTRGIGLIVARVTSELRQRLSLKPGINPIEVPVAAIYRLSLAQLEARIYFQSLSRPLPTFPMPHMDHLSERSDLDFECASNLKYRTENLSAIALVINSIGPVTFNDRSFRLVFYEEESPFNLRIHNLRSYCDKMANLETPSSKRVEGFEFNSIPNASWRRMDENDPDSVRLITNPDEIIPSDYLENNFRGIYEDALIVQKFICNQRIRFPEILGNITYEGDGDPSILVSTPVVRGQSLAINDNVESGNAIEFWAQELIPENFWKLGVLALTGEVFDQENATARSNVEGFRCFLNWQGIADCVL